MVDAGSKLLKAGPAIPDQAPSMVITHTPTLGFSFQGSFRYFSYSFPFFFFVLKHMLDFDGFVMNGDLYGVKVEQNLSFLTFHDASILIWCRNI